MIARRETDYQNKCGAVSEGQHSFPPSLTSHWLPTSVHDAASHPIAVHSSPTTYASLLSLLRPRTATTRSWCRCSSRAQFTSRQRGLQTSIVLPPVRLICPTSPPLPATSVCYHRASARLQLLCRARCGACQRSLLSFLLLPAATSSSAW